MSDNEEEAKSATEQENDDNDDDNWTVETSVSALTEEGSVAMMDTSVEPPAISLDNASTPSVSPRPEGAEIVVPSRKFKVKKYQALILSYVADVVEKITSGIDPVSVSELVKRRIKDENAYTLGNKFLDVMTAGGWGDMEPIDDKEEDDFLSDMQSLPVSNFDHIDYEY